MTMYNFFKDLSFEAFYLESGKLYKLENKDQGRWGESDILFVPSSKKGRIAGFLA